MARRNNGMALFTIALVVLAAPVLGARSVLDRLQSEVVIPSGDKNVGQCAPAAYAFCCGVGVPCQCNARSDALGQCAPNAWAFCCAFGVPCKCSQQDLKNKQAAIEPRVELQDAAKEAKAVEVIKAQYPSLEKALLTEGKNVGQCAPAAYAFCCGVGVPCQCNARSDALGQCAPNAWAFCCAFGTPCMCSQQENKQAAIEPRAELQDAAKEAKAVEIIKAQYPSLEKVLQSEEKNVGQCAPAAYAFCCGVGVPCQCNARSDALGQCAPNAWAFCCAFGTPCQCSQQDKSAAIEARVEVQEIKEKVADVITQYPALDKLQSEVVIQSGDKNVGQCAPAAYAFCCGVGVPCQCNARSDALGQCAPNAWAFCCAFGVPCKCSQQDLENKQAAIAPHVELQDAAKEAKAVEIIKAQYPSLEKAVQAEEKSVGQCAPAAYAFCCGVGVPCQCNARADALGQCAPNAWAFCCAFGTPCKCSQQDKSAAIAA